MIMENMQLSFLTFFALWLSAGIYQINTCEADSGHSREKGSNRAELLMKNKKCSSSCQNSWRTARQT